MWPVTGDWRPVQTAALLFLFSVPSVFYVLKGFAARESRKNSKALNTENTEERKHWVGAIPIPNDKDY